MFSRWGGGAAAGASTAARKVPCTPLWKSSGRALPCEAGGHGSAKHQRQFCSTALQPALGYLLQISPPPSQRRRNCRARFGSSVYSQLLQSLLETALSSRSHWREQGRSMAAGWEVVLASPIEQYWREEERSTGCEGALRYLSLSSARPRSKWLRSAAACVGTPGHSYPQSKDHYTPLHFPLKNSSRVAMGSERPRDP